MKVISRFFTLTLLIGGVFTLSACKQDDPVIDPITEYNALGEWLDGGDSVYTIDTNTDEELSFLYDKLTFAYGNMNKEILDDLSSFKKLVVTAEGSGTMLLKLETDSGDSKEISLNITGVTGSYEWNLISDSEFLGNVTSIVIISAPGKEDSIGDITITKLIFSVDVAENFIIQTDFNNIPQNVVEYDGVEDTFDFNSKWENFSEEIYTVVYDSDTADVSFDKGAGFEWSALKVSVQGDFSDFNYIVLKVSGTEGQKLLAKPNDFGDYENYVFLNSEEQELVLDISEMTDAEKNSITVIYLFGAAGLAPVTGFFTIHEAFFAEEYTYAAPVVVKNIYVSGDSFSIAHWYDGGDNNYTITTSSTDTIIDYTKNGEWTYAISNIEGDLSLFTKIVVEITGVENKTALLKVEGATGAKEEAITFDGTRQTITIDLSTMTEVQRETISKFLIFAAQGSAIGTGLITVHNITFMKAGLNINNLWIENDLDTYDPTYDGSKTVVDYTKIAGQEWSFMKADFTAIDVSEYNTLTLVLDGTSGNQVLIKANDDGATEQWVTFGDNPITVVVTAEAFTNVVIFAEGGTAPASGTFEVLEASLGFVAEEVALDLTTVVDFTEGTFVEGDAGTYTFTVLDGTTVVDYVKGIGQEWIFGKIDFDQELVAGLNTMTLVLDGTSGTQVLLKPNDNGALEHWVTFGDDPISVVINADNFSNLIFFAEAGLADLTGQFTIISATLSYSATFSDWVDNGDAAYTITNTDGVVSVDYTKLAGQEWANMKIEFDPELVFGLNTLSITLTGTVGETILVKPNDDGALEQSITFTDDQPITITVTANSFSNIIIFVMPNTAPASGSFEINEVVIYFE